ncbi:MAG: sodium-dependent transporter [Bacteroidetes bacterium]|nr:sodium-dependent transporter [Bacteroidota bacterium]
MNLEDNAKRDGFSSKFGILCAAAGSAIGLGNIWRFPYVVGDNGGGAFLLVYLGFILLLGIPVMMSEFVIGRRGQKNAYGSFKKLSKGKFWPWIGIMGILAAFTILAFYSTIAGWTLEYVYLALTNSFKGLGSEEIGAIFETFHTSDFMPLLWQVVFMIMTAWIIIAGVKKGIEKYTKILMPFLFLLLLIILIRSLTLPDASKGLEFLFKPDFSKLTTKSFLEALGQAFFSLSIGMGTLITYGSYVDKKNNLGRISFEVSVADTLIAIMAGIAIFPAVFSFGMNPAEGPGLIFNVLPNIFQQMTGGYIFALMFFVLLTIAALTSSISILEVVVAYMVEELNLPRRRSTIIAALAATIVGVFCTLSFGALKNVEIFNKTIFDSLDFTASNILLPLGGLFIVVFTGWFLGLKNVKDELTNGGIIKVRLFIVFVFIIRFIAPVAIVIVFLNSIGVI